MRLFSFFTALFLLTSNILPQFKNENMAYFTGSPSIDLKNIGQCEISVGDSTGVANDKKKLRFLAAVMSFAVPGSGEIYAENYWMAGVFLTIEAISIITAVTYEKKGDDKTLENKKFANENWDVKDYAEFIKTRALASDRQEIIDKGNQIFDSQGNVVWSVLNYLEDALNVGSHKLDPFGTQQYYEMIGKYEQFQDGWKNNSLGWDIRRIRDYYMGERHKADKLYGVALTFINIIIINHLASAVDAILSVNRYNSRLNMNASINRAIYHDKTVYYPQLNFRFNL